MISENFTLTPLIDLQNPWLGLPAYEEGHREYFYGRTQEVDELLRLLRSNRLTVLYGRSGFGKTSLLRAGLFPRLRRVQVLPVYIALDRWDSQQSLSSMVINKMQEAARIAPPIDLPPLQEDETLWEALHRPDAQLWNEENLPVVPLLVFDQFEDVFLCSRSSPTEVAEFLTELADLIEGRPPETLERRLEERPEDVAKYQFRRHHYKILLSLREDFLPDVEALRPQIPSIIHQRFRLRPLSGEQALKVILNPGRHLLEEGEEGAIAERVIRFVAKAEQTREDTPLADLEVEPALLSLFCSELNKTRQRKELNWINGDLLKAHQEEILQYFYESSLAVLDPKVRPQVQRFIEDELVTDAGFRTSATEMDADAELRPSLETLVNQRLLRVEARPGVKRYELIHDVLTKVVRKNREERELREEFLQKQERLEEEQARWKEELRRTRMILSLVLALLIVAVMALTWGLLSWKKSKEAEKSAQAAEGLAMKEKRKAQKAKSEAQKSLANADLRAAIELLQDGSEDLEDQKILRAEELTHLARATRLSPEDSPARSLILDRLLRHGWHMPLTVLHHARGLHTAWFSPDGHRITTAGGDKAVRLWDAETGAPIGHPMEHDGLVLSAAFSPDGLYVVTASEDKTAREWDANTGKLLHLMRHQDVVYSAQHNGRLILTSSKDRTARIWGAQGEELQRLSHDGAVQSAFFSHDGNLVVTASRDRTAAIWDARTGERLHRLPHNDWVFFAQFSPDDRQVVTAAADGFARLWDTQTGRQVAAMPHWRNERVRSARFSPDGSRVVTASWDGTAKVWRSDHGILLATLHHAARVESADFSPDGRYVATASEDRTVRIWSTESGRQIGEPLRHGDGVYTVQFSPRNTNFRILTASQDGMARVWDARAGRASEITLHHAKEVHLALFSQQGDRVFTAQGDSARIWNVETGQPVGDTIQNGSWIKLARFAPDGQRFATFAPDGMVRLWLWGTEFSSWKMVGSLYLGTVSVPAFQFTKDGQRLITVGSNGRMQSWDTQNGRLLEDHALFPEPVIVNLAVFDPSGTRAALASGSILYLWDVAHQRQLGAPRKYEGFNVTSIEFQSNGQRLAAGYNDGMVLIWNIGKPEAVFERRSKGGEVELFRFSPDGKLLAVVAGSEVRMYDSERGKLLHKRIFHDKHYKILGVAFSKSDPLRLATAAQDGTARLWDAVTGDPMALPFRHNREVRTVEFSPDDQRMVTSSADHTARLWEVPTCCSSAEDARQLASLAELACGNQLNEWNELDPIQNPQLRLNNLRRFEDSSSPLSPFLRWFFKPPLGRELSPHTQMTVEDYIQQQLAEGSPDDRRDALKAFPDHPRLENVGKDAREPPKPAKKVAKPRQPRKGPRARR